MNTPAMHMVSTKKKSTALLLRVALGAVGLAGVAAAAAQAPVGQPGSQPGSQPGLQPGSAVGDVGMGPHRPPMERAMGPFGGDHGRWWNDQQMVEQYKLTDAQRKAMDDIFQQHRLMLVDLHAALQKAELAMEPMIREDQPDEAKILSQIDVVAQARAELEKANARMLFALRRQLTPEQWKQIEADRAARLSKGEGKFPGAHWDRKGHGDRLAPRPPGQENPTPND